MTPNYPQMVADTIADFPITKQAEVFHFAEYVKNEIKIKSIRKPLKNTSVFDLFGTATSKVTDASINHDKYLYE
jgi:hypothetical protein